MRQPAKMEGCIVEVSFNVPGILKTYMSNNKLGSQGYSVQLRGNRTEGSGHGRGEAIITVPYTDDEKAAALFPIASLISKSEKAQQRVAPGTWQYSMLQNNLNALNMAVCLIRNDSTRLSPFAKDDLEDAQVAVTSMIDRSKNAQAKLGSGTSSHTLLVNRIRALSIAEHFIKDALDRWTA